MKCALEMNVVVVDALNAEALRKQEEARRIQREIASAKENAILFCENEIAKMLEKVAKSGGRWCTVVLGSHETNRSHFKGLNFVSCLKADGDVYANGDKSYQMAGSPMALDAIVQHLLSFCYEVTVHEGWEYKTYMCGAQKSVRLEIHIPESVPCL